ncbi:MAG: class IV adenylate cyclase [Steroidobacteraceae bacterium]
MARNVEIKARIDDLDALRSRLAALSVRGEEHLDQTDTFFRVARGRLKLREFANGPAELIYYERPDVPGAKVSHYERLPSPEPAALKRMLAAALGVRGTVMKHRDVYLMGPTRIHVDVVYGLGTFLELEVVLGESDTADFGEAIAATLLQDLRIRPGNLLRGAYIDLLESIPDQPP